MIKEIFTFEGMAIPKPNKLCIEAWHEIATFPGVFNAFCPLMYGLILECSQVFRNLLGIFWVCKYIEII